MIIMKFGGTSLASTQSLRRVVSIVASELHRRPVVVASAIGNTTDVLLDLLTAARRGNSYRCWKLQDALKDQHFSIASDLLSDKSRQVIDDYLCRTFRDLHIRMLELYEGERVFTPELQDWTLSLGEQLASRLLAAVLQNDCCPTTTHLDARTLILTDESFTRAQPRYWETYARARWAVAPLSAKHEVIVIGGFIGSTDDGRTTTIGRGGSDLTASILGAALNAEEIQVWKDVDGLLTWDPRLLSGAHNVSKLSYQEASELAHAGATILHPETVEPARRLRIPITIRNTFQSEALGTRITADTDAGEMPVKSIAVNKGLALLEVNVTNPADNCDSIIAFCKRHRSAVTLLHSSEKTAYIAIHENASLPDEQLPDSPSMTARARKQQAVFTVVGRLSAEISARIRSALQEVPFHLLPSDTPDLTLRFAVPEHRVEQCLKLLNREFFSALEIQPLPERASRESESRQPATGPARPQRFVLSPALVQRN